MTNEERLEAIEEAIASGALKVKYSDKEVTYNSLNDLFRARDFILQKLGLLKGPKRRCPCFDKGL